MGGMSVPPIPPRKKDTDFQMTVKLSSIKRNIEAELEGEFVAIPEWPGVSLGVRSLEVPAYKLGLDLLVQRFNRKYKAGAAPPAVRDAEVGKLLARDILFGWIGFDEEYSQDFANELMSQPEGRDLVKQTLWAAGQVADVEVQFVTDATKNSATPSVTS
jgi:hypothetical protein